MQIKKIAKQHSELTTAASKQATRFLLLCGTVEPLEHELLFVGFLVTLY